MKSKCYILLFLIVCLAQVVKAQKIYFNGLGRGIIDHSTLAGNILNGDTASDRKGTNGYFLFDFGVNADINKSFKANATVRVKNQFGGFYGRGNSISLRQLKLEGNLLNFLNYEVGDLNLALTPYTLYNFDEIYHDYESDIFAMRRSIANYENFNFGNKWRLEGAHVFSNILFDRGIEKIGLRAFGTTTKRIDYFHTKKIQSYLIGSRADVTQSKFLKIGVNYLGYFDNQIDYNNHALTIDNNISADFDSIHFSLYGEAGISKSHLTNLNSNGKFYDQGLSATVKPLDIKFFVSYRMVDPNYSSPGAQTRRIQINDSLQLFSRLGNDRTMRAPTLYDRLSDENIRNLSLSSTLMPYFSPYNNINPYGIATPNRKGLSLGFSKGTTQKILFADFRADLLNEVKADSAAGKRNFIGIRGGFLVNIHKLIKWEKAVTVNFGVNHEHTKRNINSVNLSSTLWDAGVSLELIKSLDILLGYKWLNAQGNEVYTSQVNLYDGILATGIRYRFSKNSYFTAQGHWIKNLNINNSADYKINQFFLNYTLVF